VDGLAGAVRGPRVTLLTPVYNEEASLGNFELRVREVLFSRKEYDFEVLFIDDGSRDSSWSIIESLARREPRFKGIRLSRNYGSHIAISAGFANAQGDAVGILACDLQDPPEVILAFIEKWRAGAQIVWGRRRARKDRYWRVLTSRVFFGLLKRHAMPRDSQFTTGSFLLVDRHVAACFCDFQEHNRITFALIAWTGFEQAVVEYDRQPRLTGTSGWTFSKMLKAMYDAFIGFSTLPIRLMTVLGLCTSLVTFPFSIYILVRRIVGNPLRGYTSIMLVITLLFGLQFLLMGIVGEYLYRIYAEVVRRPLYFISRKTEAHSSTEAPPR